MRKTAGIAGLGLIGGSLAKALKAKTEYLVLGYDIQKDVLSQALAQGAIDGELTDGTLARCDIVAVALYPGDAAAYCGEILPHMQKGAILVDCAGVKSKVCGEISGRAAEAGVRFVGGHPMAGIESSGFSSSLQELFDGAAMILCKDEHTDAQAIDELRLFFGSLGFGYIKITTAAEHDEVIAYTSQLAHLVSSAFIRGIALKRRHGFSAGSFKDLTRVAKLNADMWTELFFENKENLLRETDNFIEQMHRYRDALASSDPRTMRELLEGGAKLKIADEAEEEKWRTGLL